MCLGPVFLIVHTMLSVIQVKAALVGWQFSYLSRYWSRNNVPVTGISTSTHNTVDYTSKSFSHWAVLVFLSVTLLYENNVSGTGISNNTLNAFGYTSKSCSHWLAVFLSVTHLVEK
jgi:hypothetical protein